MKCFTHLHRMDSSTTTLWTTLFPTAGCLVSTYYYVLYKFLVLNANRVYPDQTRFVASDLGLHCLPITCTLLGGLKYLTEYPTQQTRCVAGTSLQCRCNVTTLQRRCSDVVATLCVCWVHTSVQIFRANTVQIQNLPSKHSL